MQGTWGGLAFLFSGLKYGCCFHGQVSRRGVFTVVVVFVSTGLCRGILVGWLGLFCLFDWDWGLGTLLFAAPGFAGFSWTRTYFSIVLCSRIVR